LAALILWLLLVTPAGAHDLQPGAVALREVEPGLYAVRVTEPQDGTGRVPIEPVVAGCGWEADGLRCARPVSQVRVDGLQGRRVKIAVRVQHLDGRVDEGLLAEGEDAWEAGHAVGLGWVALGVEHILLGIDHVLFVLGLALVAGAPRKVLVAATGFTAAHSVTLVATALGWVRPPSEATELVIAASVLLLAAEAARQEPTLTSRAPIAVAALFGLVHGFGFAGALVRLPVDPLGAVLGFNVGVELGQLGVLVVAAGLARLGVPRRVWAYTIGAPAGVWTVQRAAAWLAA
jgi:hydrogenase/urease accessory protein HupE